MTELIRVEKDGEVLHVHPDALKQHLKLKWKEAPEVAPDIRSAAAEFVRATIGAEVPMPIKRGPCRPKRTEPLT